MIEKVRKKLTAEKYLTQKKGRPKVLAMQKNERKLHCKGKIEKKLYKAKQEWSIGMEYMVGGQLIAGQRLLQRNVARQWLLQRNERQSLRGGYLVAAQYFSWQLFRRKHFEFWTMRSVKQRCSAPLNTTCLHLFEAIFTFRLIAVQTVKKKLETHTKKLSIAGEKKSAKQLTIALEGNLLIVT